MEKYLMMSDVFKSELFIDSDCDDVIVDGLSLTVLESFSGSDAAKFALHAINSHDELVEQVLRLTEFCESFSKFCEDVSEFMNHPNDENSYWKSYHDYKNAKAAQ